MCSARQSDLFPEYSSSTSEAVAQENKPKESLLSKLKLSIPPILKVRNMHAPTAWMLYLFQQHMKEAHGFKTKTIDARMRHLGRFETYLDGRDLVRLEKNDIILFKEDVIGSDLDDPESSGNLAAPTIVQICRNLQTFVGWLIDQPGYRKLPRDLPDYCTPPRHLIALANARKPKYVPSADDIRSTLAAMPLTTSQERRDRALIAFLFLTGVRDGALISLRLKHVDMERKIVNQDARQVKTKFSKTMQTSWFPVGEDIELIVTDWIRERRSSGGQDEDPLFPRSPNLVSNPFSSTSGEFWKTAGPVRAIIRKATEVADVPYFRPHAVRSTLTRLCLQWSRTSEELKALSQNLGHENLQTTLASYAELDEERQNDLISDLRERLGASVDDDLIDLIGQLSSEKRHLIKSTAVAFLEK